MNRRIVIAAGLLLALAAGLVPRAGTRTASAACAFVTPPTTYEATEDRALYLKAMAGYPMVVVNTLANGCLPGYLITPQGMSEGGYEADTSMLDVAFGRVLVDCALDTIARCAKTTD